MCFGGPSIQVPPASATPPAPPIPEKTALEIAGSKEKTAKGKKRLTLRNIPSALDQVSIPKSQEGITY